MKWVLGAVVALLLAGAACLISGGAKSLNDWVKGAVKGESERLEKQRRP